MRSRTFWKVLIDLTKRTWGKGLQLDIPQYYERVKRILKNNQSLYSVSRIRQQEKSVGVFFVIDGKEHKVDVVPCKITKAKGNKTSGYLHVSKKSFFGDNSTYTKADIHELTNIKLTPTKKILILLKAWKRKNALPIRSHLLQQLILDAYEYNSVPKSFTKKVAMVIQHIADNLDIAVIRSVENTNNVLTNIPQEDKNIVINASRKATEDYKYQPNSIIGSLSIK